MSNHAPFDVWDGEGLDRTEPDELHAAEEVAMRVRSTDEAAPWSEMTEVVAPDEDAPTFYFADEQPDGGPDGETTGSSGDEREPDLEELLEHQHYAFPEEHRR